MATTVEPPLLTEEAPPSRTLVERLRRPGGPGPAGWAARVGVPVVLAAVTAWYVFTNAQVRSDNLAAGLIFGVGALSLNVLVGYTGQISLGHQAFIGIGAFTAAYVIGRSHQSFYVALVAGALVGAAQAVVLGLIALRVRGLYFALITLSWGAVAEQCIFRLKGFTGGGAGANAPRPAGFTTDRAYLLLCSFFVALVLLVDWRLVATKAGRAMQALRESPQVASNYGVNVRAYTLYAFGVSGLYAGVAGALYASRRLTVQAGDFGFASVALTLLIITVVGGLRRRGGIIAFAVLYTLGAEYLPTLAHAVGIKSVADNAGYYVQALSGVLAILTLIFQPEGLGTLTAPLGRWLRGDRFELGHGGAGAEGAHARP